jgi:Peptidase of plants and bacteria
MLTHDCRCREVFQLSGDFVMFRFQLDPDLPNFMTDNFDNPPSKGVKRPSQIPETSSTDSSAVTVFTDTPAIPAIHLRVHPITHDGAKQFTKNLSDIGSVLEEAVHSCWHILYNNENHLLPRYVRSITLFVRPMGGVAYTTGNWMDVENKEIHLSADYVNSQSHDLVRSEIRGVLVHEMVHVWQHDGTSYPPVPASTC